MFLANAGVSVYGALTGRSGKWPAVRALWLKEHNACRACGGTDNLQVHHKQPFHLKPALELDDTNFITLCEKPSRNCHLNIGHCGDWKSFNPNVEADADYFLAMREKSLHPRHVFGSRFDAAVAEAHAPSGFSEWFNRLALNFYDWWTRAAA